MTESLTRSNRTGGRSGAVASNGGPGRGLSGGARGPTGGGRPRTRCPPCGPRRSSAPGRDAGDRGDRGPRSRRASGGRRDGWPTLLRIRDRWSPAGRAGSRLADLDLGPECGHLRRRPRRVRRRGGRRGLAGRPAGPPGRHEHRPYDRMPDGPLHLPRGSPSPVLEPGWDAEERGLFGAPEITVVAWSIATSHATHPDSAAVSRPGRSRVTVGSDDQGRMRLDDSTRPCPSTAVRRSCACRPAT